MSEGMRKSKKRSGASSGQRPEPTLFLDRNLGRHIVACRLRSDGMTVEVYDDHLPEEAPDEEWIELVGRMNWIAITRDNNVRYRTAELEAIRRHVARVIVIRMKNVTGSDIAALLAKARFAERTPAPFVAGIQGSGAIQIYDILHEASTARSCP